MNKDIEKTLTTAALAAIGLLSGAGDAMANLGTPGKVRGPGAGAVNAGSKFAYGFTEAMRQHVGVSSALGAGASAVVGHGTVVAATTAATTAAAAASTAAAVAVAAAPFVIVAGSAGFLAWTILQVVSDACETKESQP